MIVNNVESNFKNMVVQVLINDLIAVSNTQNAILYADDTKIYLTG